MGEHSQDCISRAECTRLMTSLEKSLGEDDSSGMRGDVRNIRDTQIAEQAVREERQKQQDKRDRNLNRILLVLSVLVALSQLSQNWQTVRKVFTGAAAIPKAFSMDTVERVQAHSNLGPEGK